MSSRRLSAHVSETDTSLSQWQDKLVELKLLPPAPPVYIHPKYYETIFEGKKEVREVTMVRDMATLAYAPPKESQTAYPSMPKHA